LTSAEHAVVEALQLMPTDDRTLPAAEGPPRATASTYWFSVKVDVTVVPPAATMTAHGLVAQPAIAAVDPVCGVAVTVTDVPSGIDAEQPMPQFRLPPAHDAVTVPVPLPFLLMMKLAFLRPKVAVTVAAAVSETVHMATFVDVQPTQVLKSESVPGFAVSVMAEPLSKLDTQLALAQFTPVPVTFPLPLTCTVSGYFLSTKVAVTEAAAEIDVTLQIAPPLVDEQPDQDENRYSPVPVAVSARLLPASSERAHGNVKQLAPGPVTVPEPLVCTVSAYFTRLNVATTVVPAAGTVTMQVAAPVHGPENASVDWGAAAPWIVTTVP
jgi:hypothetical protein